MATTDQFATIDRLDKEYFNSLRDELVPNSGAAATVAGEIIRAMDRLIYRYYNDGDMVGEGYGNETCNSSYRYLHGIMRDACPDLLTYDEDLYIKLLNKLAESVKDFLNSNPNLFNKPNYDDSRTPTQEDLDAANERDYDEDEY